MGPKSLEATFSEQCLSLAPKVYLPYVSKNMSAIQRADACSLCDAENPVPGINRNGN